MATTSGTCPRCHHKVETRHCQPKSTARCPWWRCLGCRIAFDRAGNINDQAFA